MIKISEISNKPPLSFTSELQKMVYKTLDNLNIDYDRVETDEIITMNDCISVNEKLQANMVKTLFLCNRQQTKFYIFITLGNKKFSSKDFSNMLDISRVSFSPSDIMESSLKTKIGAATIFSLLLDINIVIFLYINKINF